MRIFAIIVLWISSSFYSWGTAVADLDYKNRHDSLILHQSIRDDLGLVVAETLIGPMGAVAMAINSNFNQHGWEIWEGRNER